MVEMRVSALWASLIGLRAVLTETQTERLNRLNTTEKEALAVLDSIINKYKNGMNESILITS